MSNRVLGILIIIGFIGIGYLYYFQTYLPNEKIQIKEELEKKEIVVVKKIELVKQEKKIIKISKAEKIKRIKQLKNNYISINLDENNRAIFKKRDNNLELYVGSTKIATFDIVYKKYLKVEYIKGIEDDLYIEVGDKKFYYNDLLKSIIEINLNIDVKYVKNASKNKLIFITTKGSFVYSKTTKKLQYFGYFNDFVYYNDGYIGVVKKTEKRIINNLGIDNKNKNMILYYNPDSKEKRLIYSTDIDIEFIYEKNNKIFIKGMNSNIYELENIKK